MKNAWRPAQCYVMLSRAQNLEQIYILDDLHTKNWKCSNSALMELDRLNEVALNKIDDSPRPFTVASLNIRSLKKHYEDIKLIDKVDLFCLQETWLTNNDNVASLNMNNFKLDVNNAGHGKGVATYFGEEFSVVGKVNKIDVQITKLSSPDLDIINVYRSQHCKTLIDDIQVL